MATQKEDRGVGPAVERGGTTRRRTRGDRQSVTTYSEVSMTICVDRNNNQFIKVTFGHERTSPSDSEMDLNRTERAAYTFNQKVVERRAKQIQRLIKAIEAE